MRIRNRYEFLASLIITILTMCVSLKATEVEDPIVFKKSDYLGKNFVVTNKSYRHGECEIVITQVRHFSERDWPCRAWFKVKKAGKVVYENNFRTIDPVGAGFGFYLPRKQPNSNYFVVEKDGDYDSKLFLIRKDGAVTELLGGWYFVTGNLRYLICENSEAEEGNTQVFDFKEGKVTYSEKIPVTNAYRKGDLYFYPRITLSNEGEEIESRKEVFIFDPIKSGFVRKDISEDFFVGATKVIYDFVTNGDGETACGCDKNRKPTLFVPGH